LQKLAQAPAKREKLVSIYFDTAKQKLRNHGLSLRVRHAGSKRLQTIKVENTGARGAFGRDEWEQEIARDRPELKLALWLRLFAGLFADKRQVFRRKEFQKVLKSLQGSLGTLNDIEAHRRLGKRVVHSQRPVAKKAEKSFAMGFVSGVERTQIEKGLAAAKEASRKLAATPFWR
jgi:adenylate cyclase class IV